MADKKIIAIMGATGSQGGGLARAILSEPDSGFGVRAITRNVNSDKARELARLGAEIVAADIDDRESLKRAFRGAHGAYCVTFYWTHMSPEKELAEAKALAEAAKASGVRHVIWSTLDDTRKWVPLSDNRMPTLMGKYKVPHYDAKGEANHFFSDLDLPVTFMQTVFYWENFIYFGMGPKRGPDGRLVIAIPMGDKKLPGIAAEDIGRCAFGIFKKGSDYFGKTLGIAGEHLTGAQMASAMSRALGEEVRYIAISPQEYRSLGFPGAEDLGNMFQFERDFEQVYCGSRSIELSRSLNPALLTFEQWLARYKSLIPVK